MVVRLQTAEGKIKEYQTIQWKSGGEDSPSIYFTACGRKWEDWPRNWNDFNYLNCNHLDCAIAYADAQAKPESMIFAIIVLLITSFGAHWLEDLGDTFLFFLCFFLYPSFYFMEIAGKNARKQLKELTEYRDKGTINGVKVSKCP
jgi:hypothetical protein